VQAAEARAVRRQASPVRSAWAPSGVVTEWPAG
jgi:hypothetical protein